MKTIPAFAFISALAAFVLLPLSFSVGGSILFAAALIAIAYFDYTRGTVRGARGTWAATNMVRIRPNLSDGSTLSSRSIYGSRAPI